MVLHKLNLLILLWKWQFKEKVQEVFKILQKVKFEVLLNKINFCCRISMSVSNSIFPLDASDFGISGASIMLKVHINYLQIRWKFKLQNLSLEIRKQYYLVFMIRLDFLVWQTALDVYFIYFIYVSRTGEVNSCVSTFCASHLNI